MCQMGGKMSKPIQIHSLLLQIRWPATRLTAAQDWDCSLQLAYQRLYQAEQKDLVLRVNKFYIPAKNLLERWQELNLI